MSRWSFRSLSPLVVTLVVLAAPFGCKKEDKPGEPKAAAKPSVSAPASVEGVVGRRIDVVADENGYTPSEITVKKGEKATLVFLRTTDKTCATEVVFPELDVKKELPLNQPVVFVLPTDQDRKLAFACGMNMFKGAVVVQ